MDHHYCLSKSFYLKTLFSSIWYMGCNLCLFMTKRYEFFNMRFILLKVMQMLIEIILGAKYLITRILAILIET